MSELNEIYQELIIDHNRRPRNFGKMDNYTNYSKGYNPLCGDEVEFYLEITNDKIDKIYSSGIEAGAISGKITGAGGGGHILFYCDPKKHQNLKEKMEALGLKHIPFKFYNHGPKVLNLYEEIQKN